ncbi:unnamed protein product [Phytophthora fragariaefolia]|uniref:Unnamed protein product n=1 Tax=Phytophthora fragariaefolia TaxID=1490495 RepID=A0A9W6XSC6_9STRA|nr:unnamed protein product [Phytophthora fragariaefolia]
MAFRDDEGDARVLEAVLDFVDEYLLDTSAASDAPTSVDSTSLTDNSVELAPPELHHVSSRSVSKAAPSFTIDCREMSTMIPLQSAKTLRVDAQIPEFRRSLLSDRGRSSGMKTPRQKKMNPNRARDEVRYELVYLREKANELEAKLRARRLQLLEVGTDSARIPQLSCMTPMPRVREEVASRQRRQREKAEHEHARLKVLVERKQKMVTSLCEALQRRFIAQNAKYCNDISLNTPEQRSIQVVDFLGDIGEFQDQFRRLEAAYHEQDRVFAANGLSDVQVPTNTIQVRQINEKQIEIFGSKLLPFCQHDVGEAAWEYFKGIEKHLGNGELYGKSMKNLDQPFTVIEDFIKEVFSKNLRADVQAKQIIQRCVEANRDLILFVSSMRPTEIKHKAATGLVYHVQEYALTKQLRQDTATEQEVSLLQLCTRVSIECEPGVQFDSQRLHWSVEWCQAAAVEAAQAGEVRKTSSESESRADELRFELTYLREKVAQLERELNTLQLHPKLKMLGNGGDDRGGQNPEMPRRQLSSSPHVLSAWEVVAGRQRQRREDAEREHSRLKLIVDRQREVAIDLSELLRKRVRICNSRNNAFGHNWPVVKNRGWFVFTQILMLMLMQMIECMHVSGPYISERRLCRVIDFHGDIGEFQQLFQHLEDAYHEVDDVLQANGLAKMEIPTHDVYIREGVGGKYLEFFANKALPFGQGETSEAAWDHFKGVDKHWGNGGLYEKDTKPYTVLEDFTKEMFSNNSKADRKLKQIVRRFVEADRDIIVFVSKVSPIEIKNKAIAGLTYHLRGYVLTKRFPVSSTKHDLSLLQFCSRISIDKEPGVTYNANHIRALTRFLIGNTVGNIRCYQERIENALVDSALRQQLQLQE